MSMTLERYAINHPLGQCYPRETLVALLRLCAAKGIHLISDEIYALSVYSYNRDDRPSESFTSIRAIDFTGIIDPRQVHVLYGMSKVSDRTAAPPNHASCNAAIRITVELGCV